VKLRSAALALLLLLPFPALAGEPAAELSHGPFIGYRARTSIWSITQVCQGATIGYTFDLELVSLLPVVSLCAASFSNPSLEVTTEEIELALKAVHTFSFPYVSLSLGIGAGAAFFHQSFVTTGRAPDRWTAAGLASAHFGVTFDLTRGAFGGVDLSGLLFVLRREDDAGIAEVAPIPAIAIAVVAGKRW
jgi:hypothetical protein